MTGIVHVLDDDPAVLKSLDRLLRSEGYRTFLYERGSELLVAAPDSGCLLLDLRMPGLDGMEVYRRFRGRLPVVLMTGHGDIDMAIDFMRAGGIDFLEKPFSDVRLFAAVNAALTSEPRGRRLDLANKAAEQLSALSPREREVLRWLACGEAHKMIAHRLGISVRTVELHRARMLRRLGANHLADAIRLAVLAELAEDPGGVPGRSGEAVG
jgi:two-component system response regulator FixJ